MPHRATNRMACTVVARGVHLPAMWIEHGNSLLRTMRDMSHHPASDRTSRGAIGGGRRVWAEDQRHPQRRRPQRRL